MGCYDRCIDIIRSRARETLDSIKSRHTYMDKYEIMGIINATIMGDAEAIVRTYIDLAVRYFQPDSIRQSMVTNIVDFIASICARAMHTGYKADKKTCNELADALCRNMCNDVLNLYE